MPAQKCERNGEQGWQWGEEGKCFLPSEEGGEDKAKEKAASQGAAIGEAEHMSELLEVPILKEGIHNGFPVQDLESIARDTMAALPILSEAQESGTYRGNRDALSQEPIPGFLHLGHHPNDVAPHQIKEWSQGIEMKLDTRLIDGEKWIVGNFGNVNPELAQLLAVGFPGRSVEILPEFQNPDTGDIYPAIIRSVAFLDAKTEPAVPQYPGYSVKLQRSELGVQTVSYTIPNNNQSQEETSIMADKQTDTVKLSKEDIQRFTALENRLETLEKENGTLKGALNEVAADKDALTSEVLKFKSQARESQVEAFCVRLEKDYNLTPAAIQAIRPVLVAENGVVKMSDDAEPIELEAAYIQSIEAVIALAKDKDALFVPQNGALPPGKQITQPILTLKQKKAAAIQKFSKTEDGKDVDYSTALALAAKNPETSHLFNPLNSLNGGD